MKTGAFKQLAPYDEDWYFVRAGEAAHADGGGARADALGAARASLY